VDANHVLILKKFEEELNGLRRRILEKQPTKKKVSCVKQCNI
jgi:hypothetical protein